MANNMNTRREAMAMTLGAAAVASMNPVQAAGQTYDLVIKGGRVIDPARRFNAVADVAMRWGRIVTVAPNIAPGYAEVLDATGKLVTPGLIDVHSHHTPGGGGAGRGGAGRGGAGGAGRGGAAAGGGAATAPAPGAAGPVAPAPGAAAAPPLSGPEIVLSDGCTGWIEAGSRGADNIEVEKPVILAAPQVAAALVNIGRHGMGGAQTDTLQLEYADVDACKAAIAAHRDFVVGIKARLSPEYAAQHDLESLRRAKEAARPFGVPVMIHIGNTFTPLGQLVNLLTRGDIVTHIWVPGQHNMFDNSGRIIPEIIAARKRGVLFDVGHGRDGHFDWSVAEKSIQQGFVADTTSTDWSLQGHDNGTLGLPIQMTNLLSLGLPLERVVSMVTSNSATYFPTFQGRGTLNPGSPADVAVLEMRPGDYTLLDTQNNKRSYNQKLFATATVIGGKIMWQEKA